MGFKRLSEKKSRYYKEYYNEICSVLDDPVVQKMADYRHHSSTGCLQHCVNVSFFSYMACRKLGLDASSAARAGLLHDLYLYDWHTQAQVDGNHLHGLTHPKQALLNAMSRFPLNKKERDIIKTHMWPITIQMPSCAESWVVTFVDKYCSTCEFLHHYEKKLRGRSVYSKKNPEGWREDR